METVSDKQAENGPNFDVRIGYWLSSENILQMRLPVRPSEPLFHRIPSLIGDWLFLVGTDGSTIDTFSLSVEEQPQTAPPDKLLSITPIKLNCSEPEQLVFTPDCEIELPGDDLLINLSRADGLRVWFSTKDERTAQSISTPQSAKVIDSLNNCVAALSNDQTYKDVIKLRDTGSAGN